MDYIPYGMRMDGRILKEITRMEEKMDYGLFGGIMDRRSQKKLSRMGNETGNGLSGMRLDRRSEKKLSRMGKGFLNNVGIEVDMRLIVRRSNLTVFELGVIRRV